MTEKETNKEQIGEETADQKSEEQSQGILPIKCIACKQNTLNIIGFIPTAQAVLCKCSKDGELQLLHLLMPTNGNNPPVPIKELKYLG